MIMIHYIIHGQQSDTDRSRDYEIEFIQTSALQNLICSTNCTLKTYCIVSPFLFAAR